MLSTSHEASVAVTQTVGLQDSRIEKRDYIQHMGSIVNLLKLFEKKVEL